MYEMFPLLLFEISVLIGYTNRTKLFCKSQNLIESLRAVESSTFFCDFQGMYEIAIFLCNCICVCVFFQSKTKFVISELRTKVV